MTMAATNDTARRRRNTTRYGWTRCFWLCVLTLSSSSSSLQQVMMVVADGQRPSFLPRRGAAVGLWSSRARHGRPAQSSTLAASTLALSLRGGDNHASSSSFGDTSSNKSKGPSLSAKKTGKDKKVPEALLKEKETDDDNNKEEEEESTEKKNRQKGHPDNDDAKNGTGIEVPSLDTFINYDEATDALSSMAPILETTTTHVLDTSLTTMTTTPPVETGADDDEEDDDGEEKNPPEDVEGETKDIADDAETDESASNEEGTAAEAVNEVTTDTASDNSQDKETTAAATEISVPEHLTLGEAQEWSSAKRLEGKQLHGDADFQAAAVAFAQAALVLEDFINESVECAEDWATCRLHEALCCLKADDSATAVKACTLVLDRPTTSGAVRARALYRRAKAYMGLEQSDLALQDARAAAFLGDRRGVALYGQLMRESPGLSSSSLSSTSSSSTSSMMDELASSSALFESLLSKSNTGLPMTESSTPDDAFPPFNPLSLLSGMGAGGPPMMGGKGLDTGGLAKSVITSLSKRLEEESTQDTICKYLQKTSGPQIQQYAGMAGMELKESQATRIANVLHGVTPKSIKKTVKTGKRLLYGVQLMRKTSKVITKYRNILIWIFVLGWARSALSSPLPINKRMARLAAKQAAKAAAQAAT